MRDPTDNVLDVASEGWNAFQRKVLESDFFIDNPLVRIHCIIVMFRWTALAPWEFEFPFPGSLTSTFLAKGPNSYLYSRVGVILVDSSPATHGE